MKYSKHSFSTCWISEWVLPTHLHLLFICYWCSVTKSCLTLFDPMGWGMILHAQVNGALPRMPKCPWNTVTWLMQWLCVLCVLNNAQGNIMDDWTHLPQFSTGEGLVNWLYWPPPYKWGLKTCLGLCGHCVWFNLSYANQATTVRGLEKLRTMYGHPPRIGSYLGVTFQRASV